MAKRHPNPRLVKIHRTYTVDEIARLYGFHRNAVRGWVKRGLPTIDCRRPFLIHGQDLRDFLQKRRQAKRQRLQPGQMFCFRCRTPREPAGQMADYIPATEKLGNLVGICPVCETMMNRRINVLRLDQVRGNLDVRLPEALERISQSPKPSVNSDFTAGE